jgi:protein involved in polysaccharide export with SLBB domain
MVLSRPLNSIAIASCAVALLALSAGAQADIEGVASRVAGQPIRPGDRVELKFLRDAELNTTVTVNDRGEAVFPKLGSIEVSRFKIGAFRDTLAARYNEYLRGAELQVSVYRRVVVNGEVRIVRGSQRLKANGWQTSQGPENDLQSGDQVIVGRQSWLKLNYATVISTSVLLFGVIRSINW